MVKLLWIDQPTEQPIELLVAANKDIKKEEITAEKRTAGEERSKNRKREIRKEILGENKGKKDIRAGLKEKMEGEKEVKKIQRK